MLNTHLGIVALLVIFPVLSAIAVVALALLRPPSAGLTSGAQHFAAGAVLAAVALDMLPGLQKQGHLVFAVGGFVLGAAVLIASRQLEKHGGGEAEKPKSEGLLIGLLAAVAVDLFVDGILVGVSVANLGRTQGVLLTIALTLVIFSTRFVGQRRALYPRCWRPEGGLDPATAVACIGGGSFGRKLSCLALPQFSCSLQSLPSVSLRCCSWPLKNCSSRLTRLPIHR